MRTTEEIKKRVEGMGPNEDPLGFSYLALAGWVPDLYKDDHRAECPALTEENVRKELKERVEFGFYKSHNHRGISASAVIEQVTALLWILGDEELRAFATDDANYRNYGVPVLKRVAAKYGITIPPEIEAWPDGKGCRPGCDEGCG